MHSHAVTAPHKHPAFFGLVLRAIERARQRRQLAVLAPWQLADIGVSEEERRRECAKRFWQD